MEDAEEESEDEYELICDFCYDGKDAGKGTMHLCEGVDCERLRHRHCFVPKEDFKDMKDVTHSSAHSAGTGNIWCLRRTCVNPLNSFQSQIEAYTMTTRRRVPRV